MHDRLVSGRLLTHLVTATLFAPVTRVRADDFTAVDHKRQTVYNSPEKPGFTSWVGAWIMSDGCLMACFIGGY